MKMWKLLKNFINFKLIIVFLCLNEQFIKADQFLMQLHLNEFYEYRDEPTTILLNPGDSNFQYITLDVPIHFYSEKYNHIYINTNGILTFQREFPEYFNQPFPLEYPAIAPLYSNIDTTGSENSTIAFSASREQNKLLKATDMIRHAFIDADDFTPEIIYIATWEKVGYYDRKFDKTNTFQVVIICSQEESYVQFIYPKGGINWLQAEIGELGLPDIRAQAGFMAEDGRSFTLNGSGTDNARFLNLFSNIDVPGVWLYKIGELGFNEEVNEPNNMDTTERPWQPTTCSAGLHQQCHPDAECIDKINGGFCCTCKTNYYGNGFSCIKNNIPIRVIGSISGNLNNEPFDTNSKLQSYIVTADGRSYTAINPVDPHIGPQLAIILPFGNSIGWLFAKPMNNAKNGYQLTGGYLNHVSTIHFKNSGEILVVNQTFEGLNYWDQLSVKIDIQGNSPFIPLKAKLYMRDFIEEYKFISDTEIRSSGLRKIEIPQENRIIEFELDQKITFKRCKLDYEYDLSNGPPVMQKVSKVILDYSDQDQAVRIGLLNTIGIDAESNACTDGSATCGDNTLCIPTEDSYECVCRNGFEADPTVINYEHCVDIDECSGDNVCDLNAQCENTAGGYNCICRDGFDGNGYSCERIMTSTFSYDRETTFNYEYLTTPPTVYDICHDCDRNADCIDNNCICKPGFSGDGYYCSEVCPPGEIWVRGQCVSQYSSEENGQAICPDGYEYIAEESMCHEIPDDSRNEEQIPCDVENNCHQHATCEWSETELRSICVCNKGFQGDGYSCEQIDVSCSMNREMCNIHASCLYDESLRISRCVCDKGYEGDGFTCRLAPQCYENEDCGQNSQCDRGICVCLAGYQRDLADFCVPSGLCGGVYCAENAMCKWDYSKNIQYCECPEGFVGDGIENCKSVPPSCNVINNCGLYASCISNSSNYGTYGCICDSGYIGDGYICVKEKTCLNTPSLCDVNAHCVEMNGKHHCICNTGFFGNGTHCKDVSVHETGFLLFSQGVVIVRVPFNGKMGKPISVSQMAIGLDVDCAEGRVYWGDIVAKKIMSAKYNGTDVKVFIDKDVKSPEGIAVDWISRRLYWADSTKDTIEVASLDDPELRTVIVSKNLVNPRGIAVDPHRNKLYWSDWNRIAPKIEMSDLDGTARQTLLTKPEVLLPNSLVIQKNSAELCFADAETKKIECLDTYTRVLRPVATNLSYPFGLASTNDHFYWTDWTTKKIESVDVYGNRQPGLRPPFYGSHKIYGMTAVAEACPVTYSPCQINNGGCPDNRICLVNFNAPSSKSCKCTKKSQLCNDYNINN